jgi:hypothetical protein
MAAGKLGAEVLKPIPVSCATSEVGNDAQSERVAANAGEMLTEQIGGATDFASGCSPDHFNVMAFPGHKAASGGTWGCFGDSGEIGDGEPEARIGLDCVTECLDGRRAVRGLLCLAIEGGGLDVGRNYPTVILDRGTSSRGRLDTAGVGLF